jgi:membrane-associated PAP2 superfamily phosphatase
MPLQTVSNARLFSRVMLTHSPRPSAFLWTLLLLAGSLVFFEITPVDLSVQDWFYDFDSKKWIVDKNNPWGSAFFYKGPKIVIVLTGIAMFVLLVGPAKWRARAHIPGQRMELCVALLTLASVPAVVDVLRATTNVFCPNETRRYGGHAPYVHVFQAYPKEDPPYRCGRCFPAAHASAGFALVGLAALAKARKQKALIVGFSLLAGWTMGLYQMLKGVHYLSHTVVTMLIAVVLFQFWERWLPRAWGYFGSE